MNIKIGEKLKTIREDRKMSQNEFADILSMSQSTYSRLENDETSVKLEDVFRYAEVLHIPAYELMPDNASFHGHGGASGITFGNCVFYLGTDASVKALEDEKKKLEEENLSLRQKLFDIEKQIASGNKGSAA